MNNQLSVKILTWNMGKSVSKIKNWIEELRNWTVLTEKNPDIFFISIQEADPAAGKAFKHGLHSILNSYEIYSDSEGTIVPGYNYHVFGYLCIKRDLMKFTAPLSPTKLIDSDRNQLVLKPLPKRINPSNDKTFFSKSMCIYKNRSCTKSSVGFGVIVYGHKFIFIGSHLPVNTKDKQTYGLNQRKDAMHRIQQDIVSGTQRRFGIKFDSVFWCGDMNFRVDPDGSEQLSTFMGSDPIKFFKEATREFKPTCRFLEWDGTQNYNTFSTNRLENAIQSYDPRRIPSYCDRVIWNSSAFTYTKYDSFPNKNDTLTKSIAYSDHNAVFLEGNVKYIRRMQSSPVFGSTKYYSDNRIMSLQETNIASHRRSSAVMNQSVDYQRYIKYKTKYLDLKQKLAEQ